MPFGKIRFMEDSKLIYSDECYAIRDAIFEVYRELGNGFREEVYQQCLEREFAARGITVRVEEGTEDILQGSADREDLHSGFRVL